MNQNQTKSKPNNIKQPTNKELDTTPCSRSFRAGDTVHHTPSGEDWLLATDEENGKVQACGWPESMDDAKDCKILEPASDSERMDMLKKWAAEGKGYEHERDSRTRAARRQLSSENAEVMYPETKP